MSPRTGRPTDNPKQERVTVRLVNLIMPHFPVKIKEEVWIQCSYRSWRKRSSTYRTA